MRDAVGAGGRLPRALRNVWSPRPHGRMLSALGTALAEEDAMAKYLITGSYTSEGTRGLLAEGGSKRKAAVEKALQGLGGTLDAMYYAYGDTDVVVIADMPDA